MAQSNQRRMYLTIVSAIALLIVVLGFTPTIQERMGALPGRGTRPEATRSATTETGYESAAATAAGGGYGAGEIALPDAERIVQQAQLIRGELAARERAIAAQEDLLRRQVLAEFWKRQAAAAAATLGLSLIIVLVLVRRAADWSGFSQRLREEESRMRNLQLSVIGALEEFESELAAARAWAAAEARARRPVAERSPASESAERMSEGIGQVAAAPAAPVFFEARPAAAPREAPAPVSAQGSGRFYFGEDEHVGEAVPIGSSLRSPGEPGPAERAEEPADMPAPLSLAAEPEIEQAWEQAAPVAERYAEPRAQAPAAPPRAPVPAEAWQPVRGAATWSGAARANNESAGAESWARRFLAGDTAAPPEQGPHGGGPWDEPVRRTGPTPAPAAALRYGAAGPGTREQVERLAAEGCSETEIARRLGLSREEIHLALMLGRSVRVDGGASFGPGPGAGSSGMMPPAGWQARREREPHGAPGR